MIIHINCVIFSPIQLTEEKQSLQHNLESLQNSSSDTNTEIIRLADQLKSKQKQLDETIDSSNTAKLNLEKALHEATQNLATRAAQYERACNEIESLTTQKVDRENELNCELSRIKEAAEAERQSLIETNANLEASFRQEKATLLANIDERLSQSDNSKATLNESLAKLENRVKQLNEAVERGKTEHRAKENEFNVRVNEWATLETSLRQELDSCKQLEESTKVSMAETLRISESINQELTTQLEAQRNTSTERERQLIELKTQLENSDLELERLSNTLNQSESTKDSLNSSATEMRSKFSEMSAKFRSLEDEQVDLVDRNEQLLAELKEVTDKLVLIKTDCSAKDQQLIDRQSELIAYQTEADAHRLALEQQLNSLTQKCTDHESAINSLQSQLTDTTANLDSKIVELGKVEESLASTLSTHEQHNVDVTAARQTIEATVQELQAQLRSRDQAIGELDEKIAQTTASAVNLSDDLKNELENRQAELKTKESNISELVSTVERLRNEISDRDTRMEQLIADKSADSQKSLNEFSEKVAENQAYQTKLIETQSMVSQQNSQLEEARAENERLNSEKMVIEQDLVRLRDEATTNQQKYQQDVAKLSDRSEYELLQLAFDDLESAKTDEIAELTKRLSVVDAQIVQQAAALKRLETYKRAEHQLRQEQTDLKAREARLAMENKLLSDRVLQLQVYIVFVDYF